MIDQGEHKDHWVLVMPKAEFSLRQLLGANLEPIASELALAVLNDLAEAIVDMAGQVVHRDLKPENILEAR